MHDAYKKGLHPRCAGSGCGGAFFSEADLGDGVLVLCTSGDVARLRAQEGQQPLGTPSTVYQVRGRLEQLLTLCLCSWLLLLWWS